MSSKGEQTRELILDQALKSASLVGLEQLTVGELAKSLKLSKSGLFAHFGSKEELQRSVLEAAAERFMQEVFGPATKQPRGEPRVRAIFENWLAWTHSEGMPGGCIFHQATAEYDGRAGKVRDYLVQVQRVWFDMMQRAAAIAVQEGHFRADLDLEGFAYDFQGIMMASHHFSRLLEIPNWERLCRGSFERLIHSSRSEKRG